MVVKTQATTLLAGSDIVTNVAIGNSEDIGISYGGAGTGTVVARARQHGGFDWDDDWGEDWGEGWMEE